MKINEAAIVKILEKGIIELGIPINDFLLNQFVCYIKLLDKWNQVYNLTAVRDPAEVVVRHMLDSLAVSPYLVGDEILDVGTGAGFPGFPLSLVNGSKRFCLLDSNQKKQAFLRCLVKELDVHNVDLTCSRVESFQPEKKYSTILSRAFAPLGKIVELTQHLLDKNGRILAMKGRLTPDEIESVESNYKIEKIIPLKVPNLHEARHLVIIQTN